VGVDIEKKKKKKNSVWKMCNINLWNGFVSLNSLKWKLWMFIILIIHVSTYKILEFYYIQLLRYIVHTLPNGEKNSLKMNYQTN
jgi:hypothetical protein